MGLIYMIHFGDLTRYYIGATTMKPTQRRWRHLQSLRKGTHSAVMLEEFKLRGEDAFTFVKLRDVPDDRLAEREREALLTLKPVLNAKHGEYTAARSRGPDLRRCHVAGEYKVKTFDVGDGRMLTRPQIIAASGCSRPTIYKRIAAGVRGRALLFPPA